jgi:hypothetical protein
LQALAFADLAIWVTFTIMTQPYFFNHEGLFFLLFVIFVIQGCYMTAFEVGQLMTKESLYEYFSDIFNLADIAKGGSMWLYIF